MTDEIDLLPDDDLVLLSCAEMAMADRLAMAAGTSGTELMEAAGAAVARTVQDRFMPQPLTVLCGPGNNGGDGFVAARHLASLGWPVRVGLLGDLAELRGDAAWAASLWEGAVDPASPDLLADDPIVVDALFGAGLARPLVGEAAALVGRARARGLDVIAVDVPSGMSGDTGEIMGCAMEARATVTFFRAKPGHASATGRAMCGELIVADIGVPRDVLEEIAPRQWMNGVPLWRETLPTARLEDHKYRRGHVTLLAGAHATGAARLAALAARRAGAGLATIASPRGVMPVFQAAEPGNLVVACDSGGAFARLLEDPRRSALLIGPGSGVNDRTRRSTLAALATGRATVLDADALTAFAADPDTLFEAVTGPVLITPHEGEFARLFPDLAHRPGKLARAREAAARSGMTVVLKGPDTVIAAPDGRAVINDHAPASLATAGSGDVLAGIAVGLMAGGVMPLAAGAAASWLHGECAYQFGPHGLVAEDLIEHLPHALEAALAEAHIATRDR
ncbi:MAG: NAD(P)H-hydrate dehydratase [Alphaproteobacteria bacterium]|nr:NAD(P)H-hydrate dehydratase [Alphaproteobacteria bacterium]